MHNFNYSFFQEDWLGLKFFLTFLNKQKTFKIGSSYLR